MDNPKSNFVFFMAGALIGSLIIGGLWYLKSDKTNIQGPSIEKGIIKIGLFGPLTGDASIYGVSPQKGVQLAIEKINSQGGVNNHKLVLMAEDSKCDPKEAVNAFNKLVNVDNVKFMIGGMCSSETLAVAPIAEQRKVIMISPVSTNYKVSGAGDYIFRTVPSDALQGKKAAELASQNGFRKAAVFYVNSNDYGLGLEMIFKAEFAKLGGDVIASESHSQGAVDFRTQLTKIKSARPEVLFIPSQMPEVALIVKQAKELGIECPIIGTETMQDEKFIEAAGTSAEGIIFTSFAEYAGSEALNFKASFKEKYGEEKAIYSDYAYDAVYALTKAMAQCGNLEDSVCVKDRLYSVNFIGATGRVSFDGNGDTKDKDFTVFKIENGKFVEYQR